MKNTKTIVPGQGLPSLETTLSHLRQGPTLVTIFSGWGGGDLGFHQMGYHNRLAVDIDKHSRECFSLNFPDVPIKPWDACRLSGELLLQYLGMQPLELDVLLMSPSCRGVSLAGLINPFHPDNLMFLKSIRNIIPQLKPKVFVIENVDNLTCGSMRIFFGMVKAELAKLVEYHFDIKIENALHHGTPQARNRVIIIGVHKSLGKKPSYASPCLTDIDRLRIENVLPEIDGLMYGYGFTKFKPKDEFANTVTKTRNLKALVKGKVIDLTIPQVLKLCGYPLDWKYTGSDDQIWARAGNSIMPPLSYALAKHILETYFSDRQMSLCA